ncbi:MAG: lamin tail domain-containing protein, partial [Bacteroidales bacterium]|nr:lamin tail domain-containing protein [Bacteroidales bacterium]
LLDSAFIAGRENLVLVADEALSPGVLEPENYLMIPGDREPVSVSWFDSQQQSIILTFGGGIGNGEHTLFIGQWCDPDSNCRGNLQASLALHLPEPWDIVLNELMADADPAPPGLPAAEYIELFNLSAYDHRLSGWKLRVNGTMSYLPTLEIPSGGYAVLTPKPQGFPLIQGLNALQSLSLPNTGAELRLLDDLGRVISELCYDDDWYDDPFRREGGWALEQIDPGRPWDTQDNWAVSHADAGGSPGEVNSRNFSLPDIRAPRALSAYPVGDGQVRVFFSEPLSVKALDPSFYGLSLQGVSIMQIRDADGARSSLLLDIPDIPVDGKACRVYWAEGISDLSGNPLDTGGIWFGWPMPCNPNDLIINEILTDPWPGGEDFVELYNRSDHVVDLQGLRLCARDPETGKVQKVSRIVLDTLLICPGEYRVLTPSAEAVGAQYAKAVEAAFTGDMADFPSFPDAKGEILLADHTGLCIDAIKYDSDMHSGFLSDPEGVSLERLDPDRPSADPDNWHSAAYTAGYATPGYQNSQQPAIAGEEEVEVRPEAISPDGDGADDILTVSLRPSRPGTLANLRIFSEDGRQQRTLALGQTLSDQNVYYWDGSDDDGN